MNFEQSFRVGASLKAAFIALRRAPFGLWLSALLLVVVNPSWIFAGGQFLLGLAMTPGALESLEPVSAAQPSAEMLADVAPAGQDSLFLLISGLCCLGFGGLALTLLRAYIHPGYIRMLAKILRTGAPDYALLKSGGDRFAPMLVWKLLWSGIVAGVFFVVAVPIAIVGGFVGEATTAGAALMQLASVLGVGCAAVVWLGLIFGEHLITLEGLDPIPALKRSWNFAKGYRVRLLLFVAVAVLVTVVGYVGFFLFCFGALITVPLTRVIADLAFTRAYLNAVSPEEEETGRIEAASLEDEIPSIPSV